MKVTATCFSQRAIRPKWRSIRWYRPLQRFLYVKLPDFTRRAGWETRRHNPASDWVIIKLGATGLIHGFDIDTTNFNGNEAPAASVHGSLSGDHFDANTQDWQPLLERAPLGPNRRHLFHLRSVTAPITHLKLTMHPDGGIARFRVYGSVHVESISPTLSAPVDLALVLNGGRVIATSDQHFSQGPNLILPGRGKDMGDGWETKRSRTPGHQDWVIIKL